MRWDFWRRDSRIREEFIGYVEPMMRTNDLLLKTIQRANELGLKGTKVRVLERRSHTNDPLLSSIWFIGEKL